MLCLGIESSCDDTGLAITCDGRLVDSILASQAPIHAIFGGVVPELASREHGRWLGPLFDALLKRNNITPTDLDLIAVTRGPGLLGSLLAGCAFAKGLALTLERPLIGVNHLHAHLLATGLDQNMAFPAIGMVVSGGHSEIYRMESPLNLVRMGRALDDAAGEVFDKVGNCLGLAYPAGRQLDNLAQNGRPIPGALPLPYIKNDNLDFSFSGLKTAAIELAKKLNLEKNQEKLNDFCATLNFAIARTLAIKAERALSNYPEISVLCLAGGVAANRALRQELANLMERRNGRLIAASPQFCMDNAAMIAYSGWLLAKAGFFHDLDCEAIPRGRKIPEDMRKGDPL